MRPEKTLILVKPDGIAKNLVGEIIRRVQENGLMIMGSITTHAPAEFVEQLYAEGTGRWYFEEVVAWVSSASVTILLVEGIGAVQKVKFGIVGKYPDGIRGEYSEGPIRNVAHAPDSIEAAAREILLVRSFFGEKGNWPKNWSI